MLAFFDCFSGLSGDMVLGALIHLGVPPDWLETQLKRLPLSGFKLRVSKVFRHGIQAVKADVAVEEEPPPRSYETIRRLLEESTLSDPMRSASLNVFDRFATAESILHGCPKSQVHFHEIGGVDSLVDIVGTCLGMEYLGIRKVAASRISLGTGWVDCAHGRLPVPAPATLEILRGIPVHQTEIPHELTTPTGAALIAALSESFAGMPDMTVEKIGYGAGSRDIKTAPNLLRIVLGRSVPSTEAVEDRVVVVECTIDDMNPEWFGHVMERLFKDGALDVLWIPVFMKKNRPGTLVQVLCKEAQRRAVLERILTETSSLGVRYAEARRWILPRETVTVMTQYGPIAAKKIRNLDGTPRIVPEYDACRKMALALNLPLSRIYEAVGRAEEPNDISS